MEIKQSNKVILSVEVNERMYELCCAMDTPLGELHDVLLAFKGSIVQRIHSSQEQEQSVTDFVTNKTEAPPEELQKPEQAEEVEAPVEEVAPQTEKSKEE